MRKQVLTALTLLSACAFPFSSASSTKEETKADACAPHIAAANSCDHALLSCIAVQVRVVMALEGVENELSKLKEGNTHGR